jgi:hypothetical protein
MWPARFPLETLMPPPGRGELFVGHVGGRLAVTFRLEREDLPTWGRQEACARYLHRLAVARAYGDRGYGEAALRWSAKKSAHEGAWWLRLDTVRSNRTLRGYYERLGFRPAGERRVGGRWLSRFEWELPHRGLRAYGGAPRGGATRAAAGRGGRPPRALRRARGPRRKREVPDGRTAAGRA